MSAEVQENWFEKDFYRILGVSKDATESDIKKAYRKLARKYHPDANAGSTSAEKKFKEVGQAFHVLGNPESRKQYDEVRTMGRRMPPRPQPGGGQSASDMFTNLFGGGAGSRTDVPPDFADLFGGFGGGYEPTPRRGGDFKASTKLAFTEAVMGTTVKLSKPNGDTISVRTPAGVRDGQKIRLRGKGQPSPNGGEAGDLILEVSVSPHPVFSQDGSNLRISVPVEFHEAALGAEIQVPTLSGPPVRMRVPAGTPSGRVLRVRGKGVEQKKITGDLLVTITIAVPQKLSTDAREAVAQYAQARAGEDVRTDLFAKAKRV